MLNAIEYNGQKLTLTAEECERIYRAKIDDLQVTFDDMTGGEYWDLPRYWDRFQDSEAVAYFVFNRIENALTAYNKGLEAGLEWPDAARKAIEELAQTITDEDVDRIKECARKELLYAWENWRDDFKSEAEAQQVREHIDEIIPACLNDWVAEPNESELTLAWNCMIDWSNDNYKEEA